MNKYEEVIFSCDSLVYAIIHKHFRGYDIEDLHQVGVIGIIKAYDNYQKDKEVKFSTYAYKYIYGEICAYLNKSRNIKISKDYYFLYKKIMEAKSLLTQKLMKEPSINELSLFLEAPSDFIENVILAMEPLESLDRVIYSGGKDIALADTIQTGESLSDNDKIFISEELSKLSEEERKIIYLRYFEDRTQSEVAAIMDTSQVQISRTEKKVLKRIKDRTLIAA